MARQQPAAISQLPSVFLQMTVMLGTGLVLLLLLVSGGSAFHHRIAGGTTVNIEQHPYQVAILQKGPMTLLCGGAIIAKYLVLTAAYCIALDLETTIDPDSVVVRSGSSFYNAGGTLHDVSRLLAHDLYSEKEFSVGLVTVAHHFKFDHTTRFIPLPVPEMWLEPGTKVTVTGWGRTGGTKAPYSEQLKAARLQVTSWQTCAAEYPFQLPVSLFCATDSKAAACMKDNGGPAVQGGVLFGIMAHHSRNCPLGKPASFTDVTYVVIRNWIKAHAGV